jgi:hypothetical protein
LEDLIDRHAAVVVCVEGRACTDRKIVEDDVDACDQLVDGHLAGVIAVTDTGRQLGGRSGDGQ